MNWKKTMKSQEFKWFNLFFRDILLIFITFTIQILTNFRSIYVWFLTGMMVVWISWQLNDYIKYRRLYGK